MEDDFKLEFEKIKFETHEKLKALSTRWVNMCDWKVDFKYSWSVESFSSIDNEDNGWYEKLLAESTELTGEKDGN